MSKMSKPQQQALIKRALQRTQAVNQPQEQSAIPEPGASTGQMGQTPEGSSFGQPTDMHSAMVQAEQAWAALGPMQMVWNRIHPVSGHKGQSEDSFVQNYTKYMLMPNAITNDRVRSFLDHVHTQSTGNDLSVNLPAEQNPAIQAMSLGGPEDVTNLG